jgi:tRNA(fMet)-specific endonuclease VapC
MILLDTDTFSLLTYGHPQVTARFEAATDEVAVPIITRAEALQGRLAFLFRAANGEEVLRAQELLQRTEEALARFAVISFDQVAATEFDRLLGTKGLKKVGRADLLIASIALAHKATLVTRNTKDFGKVPGLQIENWAD